MQVLKSLGNFKMNYIGTFFKDGCLARLPVQVESYIGLRRARLLMPTGWPMQREPATPESAGSIEG
jgi:hypothetical protein